MLYETQGEEVMASSRPYFHSSAEIKPRQTIMMPDANWCCHYIRLQAISIESGLWILDEQEISANKECDFPVCVCWCVRMCV